MHFYHHKKVLRDEKYYKKQRMVINNVILGEIEMDAEFICESKTEIISLIVRENT